MTNTGIGGHQATEGRTETWLTPTENTIALMIFFRFWDDEPEDLTTEDLASMKTKWETQFLPSLTQPHCGDCTKVAMACVRCHTESIIESAKRIAASIA